MVVVLPRDDGTRESVQAEVKESQMRDDLTWGQTLLLAFVVAILVILTFGAGLLREEAYGLPHYSTAYSRATIRTVGRDYGYSERNIDALLHLAYRESRFHNTSHGKFHGLFQLSAGMAAGKPWSDPKWNTKRAIRYIRHRYGSPARAWAFWRSRGWY